MPSKPNIHKVTVTVHIEQKTDTYNYNTVTKRERHVAKSGTLQEVLTQYKHIMGEVRQEVLDDMQNAIEAEQEKTND